MTLPPNGIPCTDPGMSCTSYLNTTNTMYYEAPGASVASAQALNSNAKTPLAYAAQLWQDPTGDADGDGVLNATDNCPTVPNLPQTAVSPFFSILLLPPVLGVNIFVFMAQGA